MKERFIKAGHIFETTKKENGEVILSYCGRENDFPQGCIWVCDNEDEAASMIDAVIDPERFADDEYKARHIKEMYAGCKW